MGSRSFRMLALAVNLAASACGGGGVTPPPAAPPAPPPPPPPAAAVSAIVGADIVTLDGAGTVLADQTVVIRGGTIEEVGPRESVSVPAEATTIDGAGAYLMPGLSDMHVHVSFRHERLVYLASGITTVRDMWGSAGTVALRDSIAAGLLEGPRMVVGSPGFRATPFMNSGVVVTTRQQASDAVAVQAAVGYDFIKVHEDLGRDAYRGVRSAAALNGLPVWGHGPATVGFDEIDNQASLEHMPSAFLSQVLPPATGGWWDSDRIDFGALAELGADLAANGVTLTPTLATIPAMLSPAEESAFAGREDAVYVPAQQIANWNNAGAWGSASIRAAAGDNYHRATKTLLDAGVTIMAGSDAGFTYIPPGFALHDELALLVDAGLDPEEALIAATRTPADFLGETGASGVVGAGARADLLLLAGNPLDDIGQTRNRRGVMANGAWFDQADIAARLEGEFSGALVPRLNSHRPGMHAHLHPAPGGRR